LELSHEIDYLIWTFGMPASVSAIGGRSGQLDGDVEDIAEVIMEYRTPRRVVSLHLDMLQRRPFRRCRAVGTGGSVSWDGIADTVAVDDLRADGPVDVQKVSLADKNRMYLDELEDFLGCTQSGLRPACSGEEGMRTLRVVDAIRRSLASEAAVAPISMQDL
jgi:predicted dehydrogenase